SRAGAIALRIEKGRVVVDVRQQGGAALNGYLSGNSVLGQRGAILRLVGLCTSESVLQSQGNWCIAASAYLSVPLCKDWLHGRKQTSNWQNYTPTRTQCHHALSRSNVVLRISLWHNRNSVGLSLQFRVCPFSCARSKVCPKTLWGSPSGE